MFKSLYNATSGMSASQKSLATISNNIANSQTIGFKGQTTEFAEMFYQQLEASTAPGNKKAGTNGMDVGNGVSVGSMSTNFSQGSITSTGNKTDIAIQGDGFFIVGNSDGKDRYYTRAGNFDLSQNYELVSSQGDYVLGWNADPLTGKINTGASLEPLKIPMGEVSKPKESSTMVLTGNLDSSMETGEMYGVQMTTYDRQGNQHDIDMNYVKMPGNTFRYVAIPTDQFKDSGSIANAVMRTSGDIAADIQKGDYQLIATPAGAGFVNIKVMAPDGVTVEVNQTIPDVNQTVTLADGAGNSWFTVDYKANKAPSTATFTVGEVGDINFDAVGQISSMTGSAGGGTKPQLTFTPSETGQQINIDLTMDTLTGLSADSSIKRVKSEGDGQGAATLVNYTITDGGSIDGYYSDGSIRSVGQIAMASFSNTGGLTRVGDGYYEPSPNSGDPEVGVPGTGARGEIKAQATESSNVDISKEFVDMLSVQKMFQANTKVVKTSEDFLNYIIDLVR